MKKIILLTIKGKFIIIKNFVFSLMAGLSFICLMADCKKLPNDGLSETDLDGIDLPAEYSIYITTSGDDNCKLNGVVRPGKSNSFVLPAKSVVTLQAGGNPL